MAEKAVNKDMKFVLADIFDIFQTSVESSREAMR